MSGLTSRLANANVAAATVLAVLFVIGLGMAVLPQGSSTAVPEAQRQADGAGQHHTEAEPQVSRAVDARSGETERNGRAAQEHRQTEPDWPSTTDIIQAFSAAATTLFTGVLTWFAYRQIRISAAQARIARVQASIARGTLRETAVAAAAAKTSADAALRGIEVSFNSVVGTQRAFVHVEPLIGLVVDDAKKLQSVFVQPVWTNRGLTPAKNVKAWAVFGTRTTKLRDAQDLAGHVSEDDIVISSLGPAADGKSQILPVTLAQVQSAMSEADFAYVWGGADYDDVFEGTPTRTTRFCLRLVKGNDRPDIPFTLAPVTDFNYVT